MTTTTRTGAAIGRRALLSRAIAVAGAGTIGAKAAKAAPASTDAELIALLDEEDRLWKMVSLIQDEAQRRRKSISEGRVEIGQDIIKGVVEPIYVTSEDKLTEWFAQPTRSPEALQLRADIDRIIGRTVVLYRDRRDELLAKLRSEAARRAEALRLAGVDDLKAKAESYIAQASALSERIDKIRPATIEGVIRLIEDGTVAREENAIAYLRTLSAGAGA